MPQLLIEFFSEEIPARMQKSAGEALENALRARLTEAWLAPASLRSFTGPRRLACVAEGIPDRQPDRTEEKKGPRHGAPAAAIEGFLRSAGLARIEDAEIQSDKKGDFYIARTIRAGRATRELVAEIIPAILANFPWPKSMRSGSEDFLWVRPLHGILCVFDGMAIPFTFGALTAGDETQGHRFHAPGPIRVTDFASYEEQLAQAHVVIDREARKSRILAQCHALCAGQDLALIEDAGLLEEVAGLAEWPIAVMGDMDPDFLELPAEVIATSMRTHQKFFAVETPSARKTDRPKLAPKFITIANIAASDGGTAIARGNQRVLTARLNDARFFRDTDRAEGLAAPKREAKLRALVFHEKLGSVHDKAERIAALAGELAFVCGADGELARQAGFLAKFDLVTEMVGEFPELQGNMGYHYALSEGLPAELAEAIADHYRPQGPRDGLPRHGLARAVALADKLDTLLGFWLIGEKPTGSGDPYALRRAALGVLRNLIEHDIAFDPGGDAILEAHIARYGPAAAGCDPAALLQALTGFFQDRLSVLLREEGCEADCVRAVLGGTGNGFLPARLRRKAMALQGFVASPEGRDVLALNRRALNILEAERRKEPGLELDPEGAIGWAQTAMDADRSLAEAIIGCRAELKASVAAEDFGRALKLLAGLRAPLDTFFADVMVNDPDPAFRRGRLGLLAALIGVSAPVGDLGLLAERG